MAKTGNDGNAGTEGSPFLTITKGYSVTSAGDTVFVKAGTYNEGNNLMLPHGGSIGSPITIKNYGTDVVWVTGDILCIYAINKSYITIDGINFQNASNYNILFDGCTNITLKNLSSINSGSACIQFTNSGATWGEDIILENVNTSGGTLGLYVDEKVDGLTVTGGVFTGTTQDGINLTCIAASLANYARNIVLDGCEVSYNDRQGIITWNVLNLTIRNVWCHHNDATGIQIENGSSNVLVEDFICENNSLGFTYETGLWVDDASGVTIRRGILRNNQTGFRVTSSENVLAYHLLVYSNQDGDAGGMINSSGVNFSGNDAEGTYTCSVELYNSVIYDNSIVSSQRGSVVLQDSGTYTIKNCIIANDNSAYDIYRVGTHTLVSDYNLIYNYNRTLSVYHLTEALSWSAYKTATGLDINTINDDPDFVGLTDFQLQSTSPAINAGVNVGLTADYLKNATVGLPDIGAYEYQPPPPTVYYNTQQSATAIKNNCGEGYTGSTVTYTVSALTYSSTVSQEGADNIAIADINANKQTYANTNGTCTVIPDVIYYNVKTVATVTRNNCRRGYNGSSVTYVVPAGKYSSTISRRDAANKAAADIRANKQTYANTHGTCTKN